MYRNLSEFEIAVFVFVRQCSTRSCFCPRGLSRGRARRQVRRISLAGDLAQLKKNLAKLRKGKHGRGLGDILIEEIDWVGMIVIISPLSAFKTLYLDTK